MSVHEAYLSRKRRDARAKELVGSQVGVIHNQLLHPMFVDDYEAETGIVLSASDKGFGNTIYRTHFKTLYLVDRP
ncbi:MAG: hypothetical protein ACREQ5_11435 [Candidatus Dormibacteria bacterium]